MSLFDNYQSARTKENPTSSRSRPYFAERMGSQSSVAGYRSILIALGMFLILSFAALFANHLRFKTKYNEGDQRHTLLQRPTRTSTISQQGTDNTIYMDES